MTPAMIIERAALAFGVPASELLGKRRQRHVARARQAAAWAMRQRTDLSLVEIGKTLNREHTTVLYAIEHIDTLRQHDELLAARLALVLYDPGASAGAGAGASNLALELDRREPDVRIFLTECGV